MSYHDFDDSYPIEEKKSADNYIPSSEKSYTSGDCKYSRTCYEANCFDCCMYNSL